MVEEDGHDDLLVPGGIFKTFSLIGQGLNVLASDKSWPELRGDLALCVKTGPCPCEDPCRWALQALDALLLSGLPDLDQLPLVAPLIDILC